MSGGRGFIGVGLSGSAAGEWVDVEELEQSGLDTGWCRDDRWGVRAGGHEVKPGESVEDEPAGGSGGRPSREAGHLELGGDGPADLAFDEAEDQQGEADDAE